MPTTTRPKPAQARSGLVVPPPGRDGRRRTSAFAAWLDHPLASMYVLAVPAALLLSLGTLMVWSASSVYARAQFGNSYLFLQRQLVFLTLGIIAVVVLQRFQIETLKRLGWVMYGSVAVLMCVPFIMGVRIKGNLNWINFGPMMRLQPSEIAKIVIILWGASIFTSKRRLLDRPRDLLMPFAPFALLLILLCLLQGDLGTAVIMGLIVLAMLWNVGASWKIVAALVGIASAGVLALIAFGRGDYRLARIFGFLDPTSDPNGINYQPNQAQLGLASGGWWGLGIGASRQKWGSLSEAHTDYVLAVIGEELGLVGTLTVIFLFVLIGYAGLRIALRAGTFYARVVAAGITSWFMVQATVNIFVVLRLMPVFGVPLPLVSYGGSSLVMNLAALGILLRCAREEPKAAAFLAKQAKSKQPQASLSAVFGGARRRG